VFTHDNITFFHYFKVPKHKLGMTSFIKKNKINFSENGYQTFLIFNGTGLFINLETVFFRKRLSTRRTDWTFYGKNRQILTLY